MKALRVALVLAAALVPCAAGAGPAPAPVMINCNEVTTTPGGTASLEVSLQRAIRDPDVSAKLRAMAVNPGGTPSDAFRRMIDADIESYVHVVKAANLTFE